MYLLLLEHDNIMRIHKLMPGENIIIPNSSYGPKNGHLGPRHLCDQCGVYQKQYIVSLSRICGPYNITSEDIFGLIWTYLGIFGHIWAWPSASKPDVWCGQYRTVQENCIVQ